MIVTDGMGWIGLAMGTESETETALDGTHSVAIPCIHGIPDISGV